MSTKTLDKDEKIVNSLFKEIEDIITTNKTKVAYQINNTLVETYFSIGKVIVENEQNGNIRAEYGKEVLLKLSKKLRDNYGSGYSLSGLYNMRLFYTRYKNFQPLAGKLSWSHYCYLIYIEDDDERSFYERECINCKWSKRELKRQIDSSLFQRLLLSNGKANKKKVYELSKKGQKISKPADILKDLYVFEFLGIREEKPNLKSDLEKRLVNHISEFLMELGKGFMYVGKQVRITLEYALGGMNNNIFASNYTYYMPNKEELIDEVERALKEVND